MSTIMDHLLEIRQPQAISLSLRRDRSYGITTPGRCPNLDYCSLGQAREVIRVPIGQDFACPECGRRLRPPVEQERAALPWRPALRMAMVAALVPAAFGAGFRMGSWRPLAQWCGVARSMVMQAMTPPAVAVAAPVVGEVPPILRSPRPFSADASPEAVLPAAMPVPQAPPASWLVKPAHPVRDIQER